MSNVKEISKPFLIEYVIVTIVIMLTGFEFFFRNSDLLFYILGPISLLFFIKRKYTINIKSILFLFFLFSVSLLQSLYFNIDYNVVLNLTIRFIIYILVATIIKINFKVVYLKIIYIICLISLVLYFMINLFPDFYSFLLNISSGITPMSFDSSNLSSNPSNTIVIFTIPHEFFYRNCGPFWEPGMFGVFITIAFFISLEYYNLKHRIPMVLIITSITTLSTSTIIAFSLIIFYKILVSKFSLSKLILIISLPLFIIQIKNLSIIGDKISSDIDSSEKVYSRTGAMYLHIQQIIDSPFIGYGVNATKDQELRIRRVEVSPNGITNIIRIYGIPFSCLYFVLLYLFCKNIISINSKFLTFIFFTSILIISFSQDITTRHFFYILVLFPLVTNKNILWK